MSADTKGCVALGEEYAAYRAEMLKRRIVTQPTNNLAVNSDSSETIYKNLSPQEKNVVVIINRGRRY